MKLDQNLYEFLFETATEGMILLRDGQCVHCNNSALQLLARTRDELLGKLFTEIAPVYQPGGERSATVFSEREEAALNGQPQTFEFILQSAQEEPVYVRVNLAAVDVDGISFLRVSLRDIKQERTQAQALANVETRRLERRRRQVQLATQVNQAIATATSLEELYQRVVEQIKEQFHYYHVQLLRYDPMLEAAVLVAGYGDIGKKMMAQEHQMPLGVGLIGLAAESGVSVLRSSVENDPDWRANPLLPDTEGELAVPIKLGDTILGVLDVQSDAAGLLDADDQLIMEEVCGQIAIAFENTRLRQDMEDRLRELGTLQQLTTLDGWREFSGRKRRGTLGYQFRQGAYKPLAADDDVPTDGMDGSTIIQPMDVHGYRIGELGIFDDPENPLSAEEEALLADISTQVAEALERARLFEQTRQQAAELQASLFETETLYRASRYIGAASSTDEAVLGAAQIALSLGMSVCAVTLFSGAIAPDSVARGDVYTVDVDRENLTLAPVMHDVALWDAEVVQKVAESEHVVQVYRDAENNDEPIPVAVRGYLRGLNLRGGVLLGLHAHGKPLGILSYFSPHPLTALTENHVRQMRTIADQLVITIENQNLLREAQSRARREQLSREIATKLTGSVDVNTILKTAVRELTLALDTSHGIVRMGVPETAENGNDTADALRIPDIWEPLAARADTYVFRQAGNTFYSARKIWRQEMRDAMARRAPVMATTSPGARVKSAVAVPIMLRGQVLGVIDLYDENDVRHWHDDDITLMLNVAAQTALSLDNARLLVEAQQALGNLAEQARRPALLNEMSQELSRLDDERHIFDASARHIKDILRADVVQLYVLNDATERLEVVAFTQPTPISATEAVPISNTLLGSVVLQNRRRFTPGTRQLQGMHVAILPKIGDVTWTDAQSLRQQDINSLMVAPLTAGAKVIGAMCVGAEKTGAYTTEDENFFIQIASLLSASIENRRLFKQTQQALATTEQLYDVSQSLNAASSLQDILATVLGAFPIPDINRALLMTVNRDLLTRTESLTIIANWHSGKGTEPLPVGKQFSHSMDASLETLVSAETRTVADVRTSKTLDTPSLLWLKETHTRAVAVFPLMVGYRYLGALVLQSDAPHAFTAAETQPYTSIISQVATTVENQRLLEETRAALEEVEATQRRYTLQAWEAYYNTHFKQSYEKVKDPDIPVPPLPEADIVAAAKEKTPVVHAEPTNGVPAAALVVPLTWRDEVTGVLGVQEETGKKRHWMPEEIALLEAIASEFAQVADSLRLLDDTQRRAAREARINTISEKIQAAHTLEDALRIAVKEVGLSLNAPQTTVKLAVEAED